MIFGDREMPYVQAILRTIVRIVLGYFLVEESGNGRLHRSGTLIRRQVAAQHGWRGPDHVEQVAGNQSAAKGSGFLSTQRYRKNPVGGERFKRLRRIAVPCVIGLGHGSVIGEAKAVCSGRSWNEADERFRFAVHPGRRSRRFNRLNTLTFSVMPTVSVATIVELLHRFRAMSRKAKQASCHSVSSQYSGSSSRALSLAVPTLPNVRSAAL